MMIKDPAGFLDAFGVLPSRWGPKTMRTGMVVNPIGFEVNAESAADNQYMSSGCDVDSERAHAQHLAVVEKLAEMSVPVLVFSGKSGLPDGIYPNNAFATVPGALVVGSMRHPTRRREAEREDIRSFFSEVLRYELRDLSTSDCIAELTGPLVVDRARGVGLCGLTGRADESGCRAMHRAFGLELTLCFELHPSEYHTNIVLAVLAGRACVIHPPSVSDPAVVDCIQSAYGEHVIVLSDEEKARFAGNCIAVTERDVLMSETAFRALRDDTRGGFERAGFRVHHVPIDELEKGGGSLRCLIAEIF